MSGAGEPILVASAVDNKYLPLAEVVATSIAASASSGRPVHYHVLYTGPDSRFARRLDGWQAGPVTVTLHRLDNPYARFGFVSGFPASTFFRLAIERTLLDCHRVIYLDTDLLVETDLAPLFDTPLNGNPIGAVVNWPLVATLLGPAPADPIRAAAIAGRRAYLATTLGLDTDDKVAGYMQAGVMLLDLDALRAMHYADAIAAIVDRHSKDLLYADQCAMNLLMSGRMTPIDPRWNALPDALSPKVLDRVSPAYRPFVELQRREQWIRHFAASKPWHVRGVPGSDRWWRVARQAGLARHFVWANVERPVMRTVRPIGKTLRRRLTGEATQKR
jgi:lipopolysaccharide biosynthesis glycosyltransferase